MNLDVDPKKLAVLLIDMQNVFVDHLRLGAKEKIIPKQIEILESCAKNKVPIYVIKLNAPDFPREIMELTPQISKALENIPTKISIIKDKDNAFMGTNLHKNLSKQDITHLLLMGVNAQGCVLDTAKSAILNGFKIITAGHLIAGQSTDRDDDCAPWFKANGTFFPDGIEDILNMLNQNKYIRKQ